MTGKENKIRIIDIAKKANVSIGTVDRVIHNRGEVSKSTRSKILKIIEDLGYQPNILASTLASKKTYSLATLLPQPVSDESYWNKPMIGIRNAFSEIKTYGVRISSYEFDQNDSQTFSSTATQILKNNHDGVVLAPFFSRESKKFLTELKSRNIPYVFIDSNIEDTNKLSFVGQDSFQSGKLAAKLLDFSLPENASILILHFAKERDNLNHLLQREKGFYEYFQEDAIKEHRKLLTIEIEDPEKQDYHLLLEDKNIKGIFVTNSQVYRIAHFIDRMNLSNIRVIGHDLLRENIEFVKKGIVDFLICQRPEEQGYKAVATLFDHLIMKKSVQQVNYTSIDIITKENIDYYKEFN